MYTEIFKFILLFLFIFVVLYIVLKIKPSKTNILSKMRHISSVLMFALFAIGILFVIIKKILNQ
jgi:hypothetical protein